MKLQTEALNIHNLAPANTPLALGSSEGLGPLPEYAHEFRPRWFGDDGGFTGAQMRLYALDAIAAERERCAKLCDAIHARHLAEFGDFIDETYATECARSIRA